MQGLFKAWLGWPVVAIFASLFVVYLGAAALMVWLSFRSKLAGWIQSFRGVVPPFFGSTAIIFGVLIAFLSNDIWDRNKQAERVVFTESDTLVALYSLSAVSAADNAALRGAIRAYASAVIEEEWPRLALEERSPRTDAALNALLREVARPGAGVDASVQRTMQEMVLRVRAAHEDRVTLSNDRTVVTKWAAVLLLAFITQVSIAFVHLDKPRPQAAALVIFSVAAVLLLGLLAIHEAPFEPPVFVPPGPIMEGAASSSRVMAPAATHTVAARDGRTLAYVDVGDPRGALVLHNHGGPSSRYEACLFADIAAKHGLRLVGVDRPGIGRSSPQDHRSYESWADDLVAIADALGHREFAVTGWSEGGPWALAAAAYIEPQRLLHVTSVAGGSYGAFGDNSAARYLSKVDALGGFLALHFEPGFRLMYVGVELTAEHFRETYIKGLLQAVNDYDRAVIERPGFEAIFSLASAECFAQGSQALVRDSELLYRKWAFDLTRITRPVHMWQGLDDHLVPAPINREVADRMPGAIWHAVAGAGHFVSVGAADEIFGIVAREMGCSG